MAFTKKEKVPKVKIFKGRAIRLRMGRRIIVIKARASPPKTKVVTPPEIFTPHKIWERANREKALIPTFRRSDFIVSLDANKYHTFCQTSRGLRKNGISDTINCMQKPSFKEERKFWKRGYKYVVGLDEVGRGAFAGPVVVGAVVFDKNVDKKVVCEVTDSKLLKPLKRKFLEKIIKENALLALSTSISVSFISKHGIGKATAAAFRKAIGQIQKQLNDGKHFVLVDGFYVRYLRGIGLQNQKAIIKGDQKSLSIAAASIIAKVYRDQLMKTLGKKYPKYGFAKNKGYGTKKHQEALKKYGLSNVHRKSFNLSKFL